MNTEKKNKTTYFFIDENDLYINNYEKTYDNSFLMHIKFWNIYADVKKTIESIKRNKKINSEAFGLSKPNLNNEFKKFNIPNKYQKFVIAVFNNSDAYELTTKSEFDLTSFENININGHLFAFGKNIEHADLYTFFELKEITEEEAISFRKELMDKDYYDTYQKIANNLFKKKNLIRKQVRN